MLDTKSLAMSFGSNWASYNITDPGLTILEALCYSITDDLNDDKLTEWAEANKLNHAAFTQTIISFEHPESIMVPAPVFREENKALYIESAFGVKGCCYLADYIPGWQLYNVYAVPAFLDSWLTRYFPSARKIHRFTAMMLNSSPATEGGQLLADIRNENLMLVAFREGKLLLNRSFSYSSPDDILFSLLAVCQETGLSQQTVKLELSGLIDRESAVFRELYQYFIHISFRSSGWKTAEYPDHFFTAFKDLSRCV